MNEYSQDFLDTFGGQDGADWITLHYEVLYAKYIYYQGVGLGFKPMADEQYDKIEAKYKELSAKLGKKPEASDLVGWKPNPMIEALAMRQYDEKRYEQIKHTMFKFRE